jgi:hypothetical protein
MLNVCFDGFELNFLSGGECRLWAESANVQNGRISDLRYTETRK